MPPVDPGRGETPLQYRDAQLTALLNTAIDAIITIDARGIVETFNRAAERMFGYRAEEVIGRNVSMLMPHPYQREHDGYLRRYLTTGEKRIIGIGREVIALRQDGTTFPIELAVGESEGMEPRRFVGFIRDISARRRAEAHIREQAELLDKVSDAILVRDDDERIIYWNRGAERLYGWTAAEVIGRRPEEFLFRGQATDVLAAAHAHLIAYGTWDGELRHVTKDGRDVVVDSHWTLVLDERGRPKAKVVINLDITEKKKSEARFLRAQRLESIGTLASGIAHDLNNIMSPILMSVKLLKKDRPGLNKGELLDMAQAAVERGAVMIKQLLAFAGGLEGDRATVQIVAVVEEVRAMLEHTFPKAIALDFRVPADLPSVTGDATQLAQVLMNLCVNARDAMPRGGTLTIDAEPRVLDEHHAAQHVSSGARPGPYVVIAVSDTGEGIPPEVLDKIFDPFFTTKKFGEGTGLGLSTALGILKSHGGFLTVYSEVGRGTKFVIYLPVADSASATPATAVGEAPPGRGETVLVVDDEPLILAATRAVLHASGYRPLTATGGLEAVRLFREHQADIRVVILDMMMPGTDGPATMKALHEVRPNFPIIAVSGLQPTGRVAEAVGTHAHAFLAKPYSDDQLLKIIARVMAGTTSSKSH
jgi:PAS domain S-box-containing protein